MTVEAPFVPTVQQDKVWQILHDAAPGSLSVIGYGGAVGGGKTRCLAELAVDLAIEHPGNRILVGRRDLKDLKTTTMEEFDRCNPVPRKYVKRNDGENWRSIHLPGWPEGVQSRIFFRELKDWLSLGSEEFGAVLLEEAGEVAEAAAKMLITRLRWRGTTKYAFVAASNPWPGWFERWFIDRSLPEDILALAGGSVHFIPAKISDNPHLPENYEALLRSFFHGDDDWLARMVEGRFDSFEGQVYRELGPHMLWDRELPRFRRLVGGLDFGGANERAHKTAGVVAGLDYDDNLIRLAHFEHSGPDVYDRLHEWMRHVEMLLGEGRNAQRVNWRADKTQMWGIDSANRAGFIVNPSHGGSDSVWLGIVQVRKRMKESTSWYTSDLMQKPRIGGRVLNGDSWYDSMRRYRWQDQPDENKAVPGQPLKRDDDTADADRYMGEEADGFPVHPFKMPKTGLYGKPLATKAV